MLESSASESEEEVTKGKDQEAFALVLTEYPILFNKSQVPSIRAKKEKALKELTAKYVQSFGTPIKEKQILKKVNNMKTRLRKKVDINKTGNKKIKLKSWETKLYEAMQGHTNPTISALSGGVRCGLFTQDESKTSIASPTIREVVESERINENYDLLPPKPKKKKLDTIDHHETDETRRLTNVQLQRLVLLEQLAVNRLKKEKLLNNNN